jgi:hypothetical protein
MKFVRSVLPGVAGVLAILCSSLVQAQAAPLAWYDAEHKALAVNPYADGYGGTINIDFDFDADHTWAGVIDQGGWNYLFGDLTAPGLSFSRTTCNSDGSCQTETLYGWGEPLGSLTPVQDFTTYVTSLSDGTEAQDKFHFFADLWDVASGATTIYLQPMDSGNNSIPVMPEDARHIYIRVSSSSNDFDWRTLAELNPPGTGSCGHHHHITLNTYNGREEDRGCRKKEGGPEQQRTPERDRADWFEAREGKAVPEEGGGQKRFRDHSPFLGDGRSQCGSEREQIGDLKSRDQWITVRIDLPAGHSAEEVDLSSLRLSFHVDIKDDNGLLQKSLSHTSGPLRVSHDDGLIVKYSQEELQTLPRRSDALLKVSGKFRDETVFEGTDTLRALE